jgi:hypothetical protein
VRPVFAYSILCRNFKRNNSAMQPFGDLDNTSTMRDELPQIEANATRVDLLNRDRGREAPAKVSGQGRSPTSVIRTPLQL